MLDDKFIAVVDLVYEEVALLLVSLFELTQLLHDILSVRLQVLKDFDLDVVLLGDFIHSALDRLIFIVNLVLENFPLSLQIRKLQVDLFEDVQFSIGLEDGLLQVFHFRVRLLLLLPQLIDVILVVNEAVDDRIYQLLHEMPRLGLDIEPEKLKGRIVGRQALEVARYQTLVL